MKIHNNDFGTWIYTQGDIYSEYYSKNLLLFQKKSIQGFYRKFIGFNQKWRYEISKYINTNEWELNNYIDDLTFIKSEIDLLVIKLSKTDIIDSLKIIIHFVESLANQYWDLIGWRIIDKYHNNSIHLEDNYPLIKPYFEPFFEENKVLEEVVLSLFPRITNILEDNINFLKIEEAAKEPSIKKEKKINIENTPKVENTEFFNEIYDKLKEHFFDCDKPKFNRLYSGSKIVGFDKINWNKSYASLIMFLKMEFQPKEWANNWTDIGISCFTLKNKPIQYTELRNNKSGVSKKDMAILNKLNSTQLKKMLVEK